MTAVKGGGTREATLGQEFIGKFPQAVCDNIQYKYVSYMELFLKGCEKVLS